MHRPPAVSFQVGRSRSHAAVLCGFGLLAVLTLPMLAFHPRPEFPAWALAGQAVLVLVCAVAAAWSWYRAPAGSLRWDGEGWYWVVGQDRVVSRLHLVADFQVCMLVSLRLADRTRLYFWLDQTPARPQAWRALRRAVVHTARHGLPTPSTGMDPEGALP